MGVMFFEEILKDGFWILIPCRKGSKGLPFKNRMLFNYTANIIPENLKDIVIVSTDDEVIADMAKANGFDVHWRSEETSSDEATIKDVIEEIARDGSRIGWNNSFITLYVTYPVRLWNDVKEIAEKYIESKCKSMVTMLNPKTNPYLCYRLFDDGTAARVAGKNFVRRQEYPKCGEYSFYVNITNLDTVYKLDGRLMDDDTKIFKIPKEMEERVIDVDTKEDYMAAMELYWSKYAGTKQG